MHGKARNTLPKTVAGCPQRSEVNAEMVVVQVTHTAFSRVAQLVWCSDVEAASSES